MRFKSSAVPDDPMESGVGRIPGISLEERDGEELSRAVALLEIRPCHLAMIATQFR